MERSMSNGNGVPRPFPAARSSVIDYPMHDATERDELESVRSPTVPSSPRKRKKMSEGDGETVRRLRRSHEACTRCRLKNIKASRDHLFVFVTSRLVFGLIVTDYLDVTNYSVTQDTPVVVPAL